jgi:hypothetical protein
VSLEPREPAPPVEPETETVLSILGGSARRGVWEPAERVRAIAVLGGAQLDFRDAVLLEGVTEVHVVAVLGGVEIRVPADVEVEVSGIGILGGFPPLRHRGGGGDGPRLHIRGVAVLGGVDVKVG